MKEKILVIEDDDGICKFLKTLFTSKGYDTVIANDAKSGLEMITSHCPDCVLIDLGLPDYDGNEVIASVREWTRMPIIVISARSTEEDKVRALDLGADDYLVKPFGAVELLARIRVALRHTRTEGGGDGAAVDGSYVVGSLKIDYHKYRVFLDGIDTNLTPNEFKMVALLGRNPGKVVTYRAMLKELWGPSAVGDNKILRVHMANIRRKIEPNPDEPQYIFTETGVGYRIAEEGKIDSEYFSDDY